MASLTIPIDLALVFRIPAILSPCNQSFHQSLEYPQSLLGWRPRGQVPIHAGWSTERTVSVFILLLGSSNCAPVMTGGMTGVSWAALATPGIGRREFLTLGVSRMPIQGHRRHAPVGVRTACKGPDTVMLAAVAATQ